MTTAALLAGLLNSSTGNINIPTSNAGVVFSNSSATTNSTLNDYETGTYTVTASAGGGTITSYTSLGKYTKVGNIVTVYFNVSLTNVGSASSQLKISLPFTTFGGSFVRNGVYVVREVAATGNLFQGYVENNTQYAWVCTLTNGAITWTNGYAYEGSITYYATF